MAAPYSEDKIDGPVLPDSKMHSIHQYSYPSENDNIPSLDGVSEHTDNHQPHVAETGYGAVGNPIEQSESVHHSGVVVGMQKMKLDEYTKSKTSGKNSIFTSDAYCKKKQIKITEIDPHVFLKICNLLNIRRVLGGDYRTLAGRLGYKVIDIKIFEAEKNATESLLHDWDSGEGHYLEEVIRNLEEMNRDDVVQLLNVEVKKKCTQCNCENCGSLA